MKGGAKRETDIDDMFREPGFTTNCSIPILLNRLNDLYADRIEEQSGFKVLIDTLFNKFKYAIEY